MMRILKKIFKKRTREEKQKIREQREMILALDEECPYLIHEISTKLESCHFVFDFDSRSEIFELLNIKEKTMAIYYPLKKEIKIRFFKFTSGDYTYLSSATVKNIIKLFNDKFNLNIRKFSVSHYI